MTPFFCARMETLRSYSGIVGVVTASTVILVVELVLSGLFPLPRGPDGSPDFSNVPDGALAGVLLAWLLGQFCGSFVGTTLSRSTGPH